MNIYNLVLNPVKLHTSLSVFLFISKCDQDSRIQLIQPTSNILAQLIYNCSWAQNQITKCNHHEFLKVAKKLPEEKFDTHLNIFHMVCQTITNGREPCQAFQTEEEKKQYQ